MNVNSRSIWLRRCGPSNPNSSGRWHDLELSVIGNAAARETLVAATPHMAAIWTDLFQSLLVSDSQLRWLRDGPGIGRDARIAYSSLLGRYLARAYLTESEGVRVLVPLDVAKRQFQGTRYIIAKCSRGLEADWIGLDDHGLVIVEAKGSFDTGIKPWRSRTSPQILNTAIAQAGRTAVFVSHPLRQLPAKRWAIASRWGTEKNDREPTLLAWDSEEEQLDEEDYQELAKLLLPTDLNEVLEGLGHGQVLLQSNIMGGSQASGDFLDDATPSERIRGDLWIRVGNWDIDPGFAAMVSPFGVYPLRDENDLLRVDRIRDLDFDIAVASLSSRYIETVSRGQLWLGDAVRKRPARERFANQAGLTVVWPRAGESVALTEG